MEVRSDDASIVDLLRFQYRHFLAGRAHRRPERRIALSLLSRRPSLRIGARRLSLPEDCSARHGLTLLLETLLDTVHDHLVFHAGVLSHGDRGMLVCGPPGFGKTSLVLELSRRGLGFLSDDYAPISIEDGRVAPFPRSLGIVAPSRRTAALRGVPEGSTRRFAGKWLVDPAAVPGLRLAGPCRPDAVLLLGPPPEMDPQVAARYEVAVHPALEASLKRHLASTRFTRSPRSSPDESRISLMLPRGKGLASRLQDWVADHRARVYSMERSYPRAGIFSSPLRVTPVPASEGMFEILSDLQNRRPGSEALGAAPPASGRLVVTAARLLGGAGFFRLAGGNLSERAEAAEGILRSPHAAHGGTR